MAFDNFSLLAGDKFRHWKKLATRDWFVKVVSR